MKVLHLAAANRWTGAAAPAFAETEALRGAGVDAHYVYVGGYKLQAKLAHVDFAHPLIAKAQHPFGFVRSLAAVERLLDHHGFDIIHAHLSYDHWLARTAVRGRRTPRLVRTFHARRAIRGDPFSRSLIARSGAVFVVNSSLATAPALAGRDVLFTPPPLDQRQFTPGGEDVRARYGIAAGVPLLVAIGKLAPQRGFEAVLDTFAAVRRTRGDARLMIIGHGPLRPALEAHAANLGVADAVVWAGYHEDDLAEHYRAADVLLFTAAGSDEGHRAVIEAMGCAVIPVTFPLPGMDALLGDLAPRLICAAGTSDSLALKVIEVLGGDAAELRRAAYERSDDFGYAQAARRLVEAYAAIS